MPDFQNRLFEELAKARTRSSWNARLSHWERPASDSEEQQIERAANMVRTALSSNDWLNSEGVIISSQGSYHNNTNVRLESDMDLRVVHPSMKVEYASNVVVDAAETVLGIVDSGRTYSAVIQEMRQQIIRELSKKFGASNVDGSSNKAVRLKRQPGTRADVDIAPAFKLYWVEWYSSSQKYHTEEGIAILGKDINWTYNFPEQHHRNGIAKRARTTYRFKRSVRILKRLRDELVESNQLELKQAPSFLIECLTYAVEDKYFLFESDDRYDRTLRILNRMKECLDNSTWVTDVTEINEIKYLFRTSQPWNVDDAKTFVRKAILRMEAS